MLLPLVLAAAVQAPPASGSLPPQTARTIEAHIDISIMISLTVDNAIERCERDSVGPRRPL